MKILFITWDGPQVSYLESLFLPIFNALQNHGIDTYVLQFRWGSKAKTRCIEEQCRAYNVGYRAVKVRRMFGSASALASALIGSLEVQRLISEVRPDVLMPRSLMPALSVLVLGPKRLPPICFDADGLLADERVEFSGLNPRGVTYGILARIEAATVRASSSILVRSAFAASLLAARANVPLTRFKTVTNGRDETKFEPGSDESRLATRRRLGVSATAPLLIYSGSVGAQYRFDLIAKTAAAVRTRSADARLLMLTPDPAAARNLMQASPAAPMDMVVFCRAAPDEVPSYLAAADLGLSFRVNSLAMRAVSPIKTGEYLLCGIPVFGTSGIGDTMAAEQLGVFRDESIGPFAAADWLKTEIVPKRETYRARARRAGVDRFSLQRSVSDYVEGLHLLTEQVEASNH
jgi:glycosyltransferase involved in cell wall biosynthesis